MKNKQKKTEGARFPFRFTKTIIICSIGALILCLVGMAISIVRIVQNGGVHSPTEALQSPFLIAVCAFGIAFILSVLIKSEYVVDEKHLHSRVGFIHTKTDVKSVTKIEADLEEGKISLFCGEQFFVIACTKEVGANLIAAIMKVNKNVECCYALSDVKKDDNEEKKD